MVASCCIHPIDLTKVRLQLVGEGIRGHAKPSAIGMMRTIAVQDGFRALYSGLSASLTRQATYGTARIGLFSAFSDKLKRMQGGGDLSMGKSFLAGFGSGVVASAIGNPFDVALVRMQSDSLKPAHLRHNYRGVVNAVYRIATEEGVRALWSGYPPTLLRAIGMNVGMMSSYDQAKQAITKINGDGVTTQLASSAVAGFFCAFFSLPFDMLKTRLQNQKIDKITGRMPYKNVFDCGKQILMKEGLLSFWTGFFTYYSRCAPHAMIILLVREQFLNGYDGLFGTAD